MMAAIALLALAQVDAGPPPIEPRVEESIAGADAGPQAPANLTVNVSVEPSIVTFGEPFALVVTVVRERGVHLQMPGSLPDIEGAPRMQAASGQAVMDAARSVVELPGGRVQESIRIAYLALDTVDLKTPAFSLITKEGAGVDVPSLTVKVFVPPDAPADAGPGWEAVGSANAIPPDNRPGSAGAGIPGSLPDESGALRLEAAAGSIAYPVPDARPWVALSSLLSAGVLYAVVRAAARRRRLRAPVAAPAAPPRPAHEVALERLEALMASGLLARGETAVFVERLMDEVLRDYLTARFALSAGTRTTRELVKDLLGIAPAALPSDGAEGGLDIALVETLLVDADLVKFAKATIPPARAHAMAQRVRALVEATRVGAVGSANAIPPDNRPGFAGGGNTRVST